MTPTRALIEAVETMLRATEKLYGWYEPEMRTCKRHLVAAISSAKAAEDVPTLALMQIRDRQMQDRIDALELAFAASCPCGRTEALATIPAVQGMDK